MRGFIIALFLVVVVVVGLGFYLGWFQIHTTRDDDNKVHVTFDINRGKIEQDAQKARESAAQVGKEVTQAVKRAGEKISAAANTHQARGKVMAVDSADSRVTIRTDDNKQLEVRTAPATKIRRNGVDTGMDNLTQGDPVLVEYREENGTNVADSITVRPGAE
jgi:hypothetical protein